MKIAICDDEQVFLDKLFKMLKTISCELGIHISIIKFKDGKKLLEYFSKNKDIEVFMLDILMDSINGYEVAQNIRNVDGKVKIVFLSSIKDYAIEGYNLHLERYLLKPVSKGTLIKLINEIYYECCKKDDFLIVKNIEGVYKLYFSDIPFIETEGKHVLIHTKKQCVRCYMCLKELEDVLSAQFYRCHASFIVNLSYIDTYEKFEIRLQNNICIPLSKQRKKHFTENLLSYYAKNIC